jgi:hypothetical protein
VKPRDLILDHNFDEGDQIDLSLLLDASLGASSVVADFVRLALWGTDVLLQIDANGSSGGAKFIAVATLSDFAADTSGQVLVYFEQQAQQLTRVTQDSLP